MSTFGWLRAVRDHPDVTGTRMFVLLTVGSFLDGAGFVSVQQLRDATGLSDGCVRGHLRWARQHGWLLQTRRGHRLGDGRTIASEYTLTLPQPAPARRLTSTGTGTPVEGSQPASEQSQPAYDASQPAPGCHPCASDPDPLNPEGAHTREEPPPPDPDQARADIRHTLGIPDPATSPVQTLVAGYIDACKVRPPQRHIAQLGKRIKELVAEGYTPDQLRPALDRLRVKGLNPSVLDSVLNETLNADHTNGRRTTLPTREWEHLDRDDPDAWADDGGPR